MGNLNPVAAALVALGIGILAKACHPIVVKSRLRIVFVILSLVAALAFLVWRGSATAVGSTTRDGGIAPYGGTTHDGGGPKPGHDGGPTKKEYTNDDAPKTTINNAEGSASPHLADEQELSALLREVDGMLSRNPGNKQAAMLYAEQIIPRIVRLGSSKFACRSLRTWKNYVSAPCSMIDLKVVALVAEHLETLNSLCSTFSLRRQDLEKCNSFDSL